MPNLIKPQYRWDPRCLVLSPLVGPDLFYFPIWVSLILISPTYILLVW